MFYHWRPRQLKVIGYVTVVRLFDNDTHGRLLVLAKLNFIQGINVTRTPAWMMEVISIKSTKTNTPVFPYRGRCELEWSVFAILVQKRNWLIAYVSLKRKWNIIKCIVKCQIVSRYIFAFLNLIATYNIKSKKILTS